jgi:hypothetical protein
MLIPACAKWFFFSEMRDDKISLAPRVSIDLLLRTTHVQVNAPKRTLNINEGLFFLMKNSIIQSSLDVVEFTLSFTPIQIRPSLGIVTYGCR